MAHHSLTDSSGSENELEVLDIIHDNAIERTKRRTFNHSANNQTPLSFSSYKNAKQKIDDDEFNVKLPSIFLQDARKNEIMLKRGVALNTEIEAKSMQNDSKCSQTQRKREVVLKEIEFHDANFPFSLESEVNTGFIDKILEEDELGNRNIRHYYFFSNINDTRLEKHSKPTFTNLISRLSDLPQEILQKEVGQNLALFVYNAISHVKASSELIQIQQFILSLHDSNIKFLAFDGYSMRSSMTLIGGSLPDLRGSESLKLRPYHFLTNQSLTMLKSSLVIILELLLLKQSNSLISSYRELVKVSMLTVLDHNILNCYELDIKRNFIEPVFGTLFEVRYNILVKNHTDIKDIENYARRVIVLEWFKVLNCCTNYTFHEEVELPLDYLIIRKYESIAVFLKLLSSVNFESNDLLQKARFDLCYKFAFGPTWNLNPSAFSSDLNLYPHRKEQFLDLMVKVIKELKSTKLCISNTSRSLHLSATAIEGYFRLYVLNFSVIQLLEVGSSIESEHEDQLYNFSLLNLKNRTFDLIFQLKENVHKEMGMVSIRSNGMVKGYISDFLTKYYFLLQSIYTSLDVSEYTKPNEMFYT